jgi:hypothetical protein
MESFAKKFAEVDSWGSQGLKMRRYDKFGTMFGFHVRGAYNYQTKFGAIFTMIYWLLVMTTFAYYLFKWRDKSRPSVMWNEFRAEQYPEIDLWKENFHFYIMPFDKTSGKHVPWDQFWSSFHIYATIMDRSEHVIGTQQQWSNIPLQKCGEQEWAKALPDTDISKNLLLKYGICLNPLKMVRSKLARFKEILPVRGGTGLGSQQVLIDFYQCLPGGALPTTGVPATCDTQFPSSVLLTVQLYEKTVNIKYYEQPIGSAHAEIDRFSPSKTLRHVADVDIKQLDLYTDVGHFVKDWKKEHVPTIHQVKRSINERSVDNIVGNYMSQGKIIMADF